MTQLRRVDADLIEKPQKRARRGRSLSPEQQTMVRRLQRITDESVVYEAILDPGEKAPTVRQRLLRAADVAGVDVAVRRSQRGFYVGLMTPSRRSNRGRKPAVQAASAA